MSDLISRQAAIDAVGDVHPLDYNGQAILNKIKLLPSAEQTGAWVWKEDGYKCSLCGNYVYGSLDEIYSGNYKYCPYCGARMTKDE